MNLEYNIIHRKVRNLDILINPNNYKYKPKKKKKMAKRKSFYLRQMIPFPSSLKVELIDTLLYSDSPGFPNQTPATF